MLPQPALRIIGKTRDNRPIFELLEDYRYKNILIPMGFQTDLASVPRVPLAYLFCGNTANAPALIHDYIYREDAVPVYERNEGDELFKEAMEEDKETWFRRWVMYSFVRAFGWMHYHELKVSDKLI